MTTPLLVVPPLVVTDSMLGSTDVPETDYAAYAGGTTYALGARVIRTATHRIYESLQAANTGHTPESSPTWWVDAGPTNRWALFDNSNSTSTAQSTSMSYTLTPAAAINALALLNLVGATSVRVRLTHPSYGTMYDVTTNLASTPAAPGWWEWFFGTRTGPALSVWTDLPGILGCTLIVDLAGTTALSVGVMLFGQQQGIGLGVLLGARVGIDDYSRIETNDFGDTVLVQRAFAKRASFSLPVLASQVDAVIEFLAAYRATPVLWIGTRTYGSTVIYGFFKTMDVSITHNNVSDCSLEIRGLT